MRVGFALLFTAALAAWSSPRAEAATADLGGWTVSFASDAAEPAPVLSAWPTLWTADPPAPAVAAEAGPGTRRLAVHLYATAIDDAPAAQGSAPQKAFEYSDAYATRRKIHYIASFATLPLFVTEYVLGQKLFDGTASGGVKTAHSAVAFSLGALFGVNTVTGVWNAWEARKDPNGRAKRLWHGALMLAADAGFVATGALAPDSEHGNFGDQRSTHRAVALASMSTATVGYLIMLFGR